MEEAEKEEENRSVQLERRLLASLHGLEPSTSQIQKVKSAKYHQNDWKEKNEGRQEGKGWEREGWVEVLNRGLRAPRPG